MHMPALDDYHSHLHNLAKFVQTLCTVYTMVSDLLFSNPSQRDLSRHVRCRRSRAFTPIPDRRLVVLLQLRKIGFIP